MPSEPHHEDYKYRKVNVPDDQILAILTHQLIPEQMAPLNKILDYCKSVVKSRKCNTIDVQPIRLLIHGGAGVGKSAVIKTMTLHSEKILRKVGDNPHHPRVLVCAPTGKAASLVNGITLHSGFDFKFGHEHRALSDKNLAKFRENLKELKLIIIDEVSLLGADMLYKLHMRLCEIFQADLSIPFARISVVLVGDLLQLPPVNARYIFEPPVNNHFQAYHDINPLFRIFDPVVLKENHRQGKANEWAECLNRFREGVLTQSDKELLNSRVTKSICLDKDAMNIFYTNSEVSAHNERMLNAIDSPLISIKARITGPRGKISEDGRIGSTQFFETLQIKLGARCVLTWNISTVDNLVNGSSGTIIGVEYSRMSKERKVEAIIVSFDDDTAGIAQREKYRGSRFIQNYKDTNGTPILRQEVDISIPKGKGKSSHTATSKITQFPIRLFYASTAHKMQGQTLKSGCKVVIHWTKKMQREEGMGYVMLGRSERIDDIFIVSEYEIDEIKCSLKALGESNRILKDFNDKEEKEALISDEYWTISYLNIRSFRAHMNDLVKDSRLMSSEVISLGETWLLDQEKPSVEGFRGLFASHGFGKGVAVYSKKDSTDHFIFTSETLSLIKICVFNIDIISVYQSKSSDEEKLFNLLHQLIDDKATAILGDFNIDYERDNNLNGFMKSKGFSQLIKNPTCETGHIIDHLYVNKYLLDISSFSRQFSVHYSDHDIITLFIRK